jgi:hypothetical protein
MEQSLPSWHQTNRPNIGASWSAPLFTRKFLMQSIQNRLCLPQSPLCLGRLFVFIREPLRLLTVCFFGTDSTLPAIFIAETSCPILRFWMSPNAGHPITILITSSANQHSAGGPVSETTESVSIGIACAAKDQVTHAGERFCEILSDTSNRATAAKPKLIMSY